MNIKLYLIMIFIFIPYLLLNSIEIKLNIVNNSLNKEYSFSFMKNNKVLLFDGKFFLTYDYNENKILEKVKVDKGLYPEIFNLQNNKILTRRLEKSHIASIYDIKTGKYENLIKFFGEEKYFPYYENHPLYWDYYGNNDLIIYHHSDPKFEVNKREQDYGIYKMNIKTGEKKILINKVGFIDYNHGLLLYFVKLNNKNKIYLYDQKNNKTKLLNTDSFISDYILEKMLKIFKNNYYLTNNMNGELFLFDGNTGKLHEIKLKEKTSLLNIKYDFDSNLIGAIYRDRSDIKNKKEGFILLKLEIIE